MADPKGRKEAVVTEAPVTPAGDKTAVTLLRETGQDGSQESEHDEDTVYVKGHPVIRNGNQCVLLPPPIRAADTSN